MAHPIWPLFDLVVRTPLLELRALDDDRAAELGTLAAAGIHDGPSPFRTTWNLGDPATVARSALQHYWGARASWSVDDWNLMLAVVVDGTVVGTQAVMGVDYPVCRTVTTGSWLGLAHQGKGYGREMRAAILQLAFAGLGAARAETAAWEDNTRSIAVTRGAGYVDNGQTVLAREGLPTVELGFVLTRQAWEARRRTDIEIDGLEPCLELFGLAGDT